MEAATAEAYAAAEAATLQAAAEHMQNLDPAALAASQQLEAITAALQQHANSSNMTAALEHLSNAKPEDLLAHLAVVSAVTGGAVEGVPAQHAEQHDVDGNQDGGAGGDRPLTSRYRYADVSAVFIWERKRQDWTCEPNSYANACAQRPAGVCAGTRRTDGGRQPSTAVANTSTLARSSRYGASLYNSHTRTCMQTLMLALLFDHASQLCSQSQM